MLVLKHLKYRSLDEVKKSNQSSPSNSTDCSIMLVIYCMQSQRESEREQRVCVEGGEKAAYVTCCVRDGYVTLSALDR